MKFREHRWPIEAHTQVLSPHGPCVVRLRNICRFGVRLDIAKEHSTQRLQRDMPIKIMLAGAPRDGLVRWVRGGMVGLRLAHRLSDDELTAVRQIPRNRLSAQPGYPTPNIPGRTAPGRRINSTVGHFREL